MQTTHTQMLMVSLALLLMPMLGCSSMPEVAPPVNPQRATEILKATLSAWREGLPITDVEHAAAPVIVQDIDWLENRKLTSFELVDAGTPQDANLRIDVVLTFAEPTQTKRVTYIVGTGPKQTVFRAFE